MIITQTLNDQLSIQNSITGFLDKPINHDILSRSSQDDHTRLLQCQTVFYLEISALIILGYVIYENLAYSTFLFVIITVARSSRK